MAKRTPEQIAADWANKLGGATQKIQDGIDSVTVAPGQAAARAKDMWVQNTQAAKDKWAANTQAVTLQEWQDAMKTKGVGRIASGAQAAQGKMASFLTDFLPHLDRVKATLPPRGDLEANILRSQAMIRGTAKFRKQG